MNQQSALNNIVRLGSVSSVDPNDRTARVIFADKQDSEGNPLISAKLKVLQNQPLIVFKSWEKDESVICGEDSEIVHKILIGEGGNPNYTGIYHSAKRGLGTGEKYAVGEVVDTLKNEPGLIVDDKKDLPGCCQGQAIYTTNEPDYIKEHSGKTLIKVYPWLPYIGQLVVCLNLPNSDSDGFVIGGL